MRPAINANGRPRRTSTFVSIGVPTVAPSVVMSACEKSAPSRSWRCAVQTTTGTDGSASSAALAKAGGDAMVCSEISTSQPAAAASRANASPSSRDATTPHDAISIVSRERGARLLEQRLALGAERVRNRVLPEAPVGQDQRRTRTRGHQPTPGIPKLSSLGSGGASCADEPNFSGFVRPERV